MSPPPTPPPVHRPHPRPISLKLKPPNPSTPLLLRANLRLSEGNANTAREIYTEVLTRWCPGHPVALLNRALAYLKMDYPELAVMDAYRCAELISEVQAEEERAARLAMLQRRKREAARKKREELQSPTPSSDSQRVESLEDIAHKSTADVADEGVDEAELEEASSLDDAHDAALGLIEQQTISYLLAEERQAEQCKAWTYRPLTFTGGGWLSQGLAAIRISEPDPYCAQQRRWSRSLEVRAVYRLIGALGACGLGATHDAQDLLNDFLNADKRFTNSILTEYEQFCSLSNVLIREALLPYDNEGEDSTLADVTRQLRLALANRVNYPWTGNTSTFGSFEAFEDLLRLVDKTAPKCMVKIESETRKRPRMCFLTANKDIMQGERFLNEDSCFQVTSGLPGGTASENQIICDACASLLVVPKNAYRSLPFCESCGVTFCSDKCRDMGLDYHDPPCNVLTDHFIRSWFEPRPSDRKAYQTLKDPPYHPKGRCLIMLMLHRILAYAEVTEQRALDIPAIRLLNGGLHATSQDGKPYAASKTMPWSFKTHVVLPLSIQKRMGIAAYAQMETFDGWAINTLLNKISTSMVIHKAPRVKMVYSRKAILLREETLPDNDALDDIWVGSLYPAISLVAGVRNDTIRAPNAVVSGGRTMYCTAICKAGAETRASLPHEGKSINGHDEVSAEDVYDIPTPKVAIHDGQVIERVELLEPWSKNWTQVDSSSSSSDTIEGCAQEEKLDVEMKDADYDSDATEDMDDEDEMERSGDGLHFFSPLF